MKLSPGNEHKMTRTLIFILTLGFLFSCSFKNSQKNGNVTTSVDFKSLDTTVSFAGYWLSEEYFKSITEFKSPKKAQDGCQFIVIPDKTLKQTIMIYNFHEGGPFLKILKNKYSYEMWEMQDDSLNSRLSEIQIVSPTKIKIGDRNFVKINSIERDDNYLVLEEILFKGHYITAEGKNIEFKNNGQVEGLGIFYYYNPIVDYFDEGMQVDQVRFGKSKEDNEYFGFTFNTDTLEIYKLKCLVFDSTSGNCAEVEFGQLIYKLWRKK
ncbi:MAG: hypothetical protein ABI723_00525 [Bacteroidia bacterium]